MSRYRPPRPTASKYITPEGHARLTQELNFLWRKKRPEVTSALSAAAAEGDRSENAEYIYRKKQLREIDSRVRHLRKRLENMVIVREAPHNHERIYFGAWVELEGINGELQRYRIVGPDEFDMHEQFISMDAPLAKSLMGKTLDDEITIETPSGAKTYIILSVEYIFST